MKQLNKYYLALLFFSIMIPYLFLRGLGMIPDIYVNYTYIGSPQLDIYLGLLSIIGIILTLHLIRRNINKRCNK